MSKNKGHSPYFDSREDTYRHGCHGCHGQPRTAIVRLKSCALPGLKRAAATLSSQHCALFQRRGLPKARCTTRLWALRLVIASAPRTRPLTPYAAAAAPSGLGAAPAARPPFSINAPQRRSSGFQFSRPPPCLPVRGLFEKINPFPSLLLSESSRI